MFWIFVEIPFRECRIFSNVLAYFLADCLELLFCFAYVLFFLTWKFAKTVYITSKITKLINNSRNEGSLVFSDRIKEKWRLSFSPSFWIRIRTISCYCAFTLLWNGELAELAAGSMRTFFFLWIIIKIYLLWISSSFFLRSNQIFFARKIWKTISKLACICKILDSLSLKSFTIIFFLPYSLKIFQLKISITTMTTYHFFFSFLKNFIS